MKVTTDGCLFGAWVAQQVSEEQHDAKDMMDIGTGTGLLTLMVAQKNPRLIIDAIEIDDNACKQARQNIAEAGLKNEIRVLHDNIHHEKSGKKYDIIVSNPPFYENEIKSANNQKNLAHHDNGLLLEDLLPVMKTRLNDNGVFYLLLPYKRKNEIELLFRKNHLYPSKKILVRQSAKHEYFRLLIEGKMHEQQTIAESETSICDESGNYTSEFIDLLKDYYLYL